MIINGMPASHGVFTGKAYIATYEHEDIDSISANTVLVGKSFWVEDDLLLYKAKAVVTEIGGLLCHAAIICRELGKPCVVGVDDLLSLVKNNDTITVDGTNGNIILEKEVGRQSYENPGYINFIDNMKKEQFKGITIFTEEFNGKLYLYFPKTTKEIKEAAIKHLEKQNPGMNILEAKPKPPAIVIEKYSYFKIHLENLEDKEYAKNYDKSLQLAHDLNIKEAREFIQHVYKKAYSHLQKCLECYEKSDMKNTRKHVNLYTGYFEQISKVSMAKKTFQELEKGFMNQQELGAFLVKADGEEKTPNREKEFEVYAFVKEALNKKKEDIKFGKKTLAEMFDKACENGVRFG
ncbi:MAG: hypothetical protein J4432_04850 [DPANN group archaeon]|nr:hypothetical protein [DPANN group archaeon]